MVLLAHLWPLRCKVISDMKADRSSGAEAWPCSAIFVQKHGRMWTAKATGDLNASWHFTNAMFLEWEKNWLPSKAFSLHLSKPSSPLSCRPWISHSVLDYFSPGHISISSVINTDRWASLQSHTGGLKGYSIFYILRIKVTRERKLFLVQEGYSVFPSSCQLMKMGPQMSQVR